MREAGAKLADLCGQMLTYSGRGKFVKRSLDLNESLGRLTDLVRASTAKSVQIDYNLSSDLPPIRGDETQLDQIVINLVINASDSMTHLKTGHIRISTGEQILDAGQLKKLSNGEAADPGRYVYIEVADEGSGIEAPDIPRLFEPFFTTKFTGRGLGMAVVFGIVKSHRGVIDVNSTPGVGTRIRIYFPANTERQVMTTNRDRSAPQGTVLVVDDEEMVRNTVCNMLESAGYEVITANDGKLGYAVFLENEDLLSACVIDATMPELDGYSLAEKIRARRQLMPVVLVSGYQVEEFDTENLGRTNIVFLQKPFDSTELVSAVASAGNDFPTDPAAT